MLVSAKFGAIASMFDRVLRALRTLSDGNVDLERLVVDNRMLQTDL